MFGRRKPRTDKMTDRTRIKATRPGRPGRLSYLTLIFLLSSLVGSVEADPVNVPPLSTSGTGAHADFTSLLDDYVDGDRVDYAELCKDDRLDSYIARLAATDPTTITDDKTRLAFWTNAYNAYTLKIICDNYPLKSIRDLHFGGLIIGTVTKKNAWDRKFVVIGGKEYSLNNIEHDIIRPEFKDARAHFALVCAARSCPPLRPEAFEGATLDEQLDDQGRVFLAQTDKNRFDDDKKIAYLSKIMDWYGGDFGSNDEAILVYLLPFLPEDAADNIRANPGAWDIKHTEYDWSLND